MIPLLAALNILIAILSLAVGVVFGRWYFCSPNYLPPVHTPQHTMDGGIHRKLERSAMAATQVRDITQRMMSDVNAHSDQVEEFHVELKAHVDNQVGNDSDAVFATIGRMMVANRELQTKLARAEQRIAGQEAELRCTEAEARTDSLTGLPNRRAFDDELQRRGAEWKRLGRPFSLIVLDIDHFKQFNDRFGHAAGDAVLKEVAKVLKQNARQMDLACRYGGEEFAIVLPATDVPEARTAAERYRKAIEAAKVVYERQTLSVTASVGVARIRHNEESNILLRRADEALYVSKDSGRNCGHWHDGSACSPVLATLTPPKNHDEARGCPDRCIPELKFLESLQRRINESQRYSVPLSLVVLKVHGYPHIKEQLADTDVNRLIHSAGEIIQSALREIDLFTRVNDGEFMVLLPGSTLPEAKQMTKRLRLAVDNHNVQAHDRKFALQFAPGISQLGVNEGIREFIGRAREGIQAEEPV